MKRREIIKIAALGVSATLLPNVKVYADKGVAKSPAQKKYKAVSEKRFYESASPDEVFPKIFEVGKESALVIEVPHNVAQFENLWVACANEDGFDLLNLDPYFPEYRTLFADDAVKGYKKQPKDFSTRTPAISYKKIGDKLHFEKIVFPKEGRYVFSIRDGKKTVARAWVYALDADLFALRPYCGDIHMHSTFSDGKDTNVQMAITGLARGFDFMAVSDHNCRIGSTDLIEKLGSAPISLKLFAGEEAHGSMLHINNFDSSGSIADWLRNDRSDFDARTNRILATIPDSYALGKLDRLTLAQSEAVFEKIREMGGMSVFNHPYWRRNGEQLNCSDALRDALIKRGKFDAFEVNCAINYDSTDLTIARHAEASADGRYMPVVGCSDAHCAAELGAGLTMVFAESTDSRDIRRAILSLKSVAIDTFGSYERPKMLGKIRMMKYASFLWKNFFPLHDEICKAQAAALKEYIDTGKSEESAKNLKKERDALFALYKRVWG